MAHFLRATDPSPPLCRDHPDRPRRGPAQTQPDDGMRPSRAMRDGLALSCGTSHRTRAPTRRPSGVVSALSSFHGACHHPGQCLTAVTDGATRPPDTMSSLAQELPETLCYYRTDEPQQCAGYFVFLSEVRAAVFSRANPIARGADIRWVRMNHIGCSHWARR